MSLLNRIILGAREKLREWLDMSLDGIPVTPRHLILSSQERERVYLERRREWSALINDDVVRAHIRDKLVDMCIRERLAFMRAVAARSAALRRTDMRHVVDRCADGLAADDVIARRTS